jgi:hypothetical protein
MSQEFHFFDGKTLSEVYIKGLPGGFRDEIVEMTFESKKAFEAECYRATIILAAEALQRVNCELILQYAKSKGGLSMKLSKNKSVNFEIVSIEDSFNAIDMLTDEMTFCDTIYILRQLGLISHQVTLDMHALRNLRNHLVHSRFSSLHLLDYTPPNGISLEEVEEILSARDGLPLKYCKYRFPIEVNKESIEYVVDQEKLNINIEKQDYEKQFAIIALGILFYCMQQLSPKFIDGTFS